MSIESSKTDTGRTPKLGSSKCIFSGKTYENSKVSRGHDCLCTVYEMSDLYPEKATGSDAQGKYAVLTDPLQCGDWLGFETD